MAISQFSWARSHYGVIVTSPVNGWYMVLILVSMERGCPYLYIGSKFRGYMTFNIDNPERVATTPLRKMCLGKPIGKTRVNTSRISPERESPKNTHSLLGGGGGANLGLYSKV